MIKQKQNLELYMGELLNVMYFEHADSMYFTNDDDESIEVQGVTPHHLCMLMRNIVCCASTRIVLKELTSSDRRHLKEMMDKLAEMFAQYNREEVDN